MPKKTTTKRPPVKLHFDLTDKKTVMILHLPALLPSPAKVKALYEAMFGHALDGRKLAVTINDKKTPRPKFKPSFVG